MNRVTFITGNQFKAAFMAKFLDYPVEHQKIELDEIQSLDLHKITEHKARQAYELIKSPVLVEDIGLTIKALGDLPGPLIKWFEEALGLQGICDLVDNLGSREARAAVVFAYFDGLDINFFDGAVEGKIIKSSRGDDSFGWNSIFVRDGCGKTFAQMTDEELKKYSLRTTTVFPEIKTFLEQLKK